ncbi:MAG: HAMP domain-containing protein [Halanaerobiales bacterium]|nr:HAMP domain-containing protein [Halanaerobiales bacterium]
MSKQKQMMEQGQRVAKSIARFIQRDTQSSDNMMGMMRKGMWSGLIENQIKDLEQVLGATIWLIDRDGKIYEKSNIQRQLYKKDLNILLAGKSIIKYDWNDALNQPIIAVAMPIKLEKEVIGGLFIITPMAEIRFTEIQIRKIIVGSALIGVLMAIILASVFSRRLTRPILSMQKMINQMKKGDFSGKLEVNTGDELEDLANHFNDLNKELDQTIALLQAEQEQTQRIINSMAEGVISLNSFGEVVVMNPTAQRIFKAIHLTENDLKSVLKNLPGLQEQIEDVQRKNSLSMQELEYNGQIFHSIVSPISTGEGEPILGVVIVLQDITNRWRLIQLQKDLISNVSHEFKTPLTSIKGFVELMMDDKIQDEKIRYNTLEIIYRETVRLTRMVNDLLSMARIESQRLRKEPINLMELIEDIIESLTFKLTKAKVTVKLDNFTEKQLIMDSDRMEQVFYNLLDNGIRFSPEGSVIEIWAEDKDEMIEINIRDHGPGIPEEEQESVFDRFYKVEKARTANDTGSGLGLAIVKNIIVEHGGRIKVSNHLGGGALFTIELPK